MANSFDELMTGSNNNFKKLQEKIKTLNQGGGKGDPTFYKVKKDEAGNANVIMRFMPAPKGEEMPYVMYYDHFFQGPSGKYYAELSRTTLGQGEPDPVSEENSRLWKTDTEENKKLASSRKRRQQFVSNVYIIQDKAQPECEGKVFKYQYGIKIFEKIKGQMSPEYEGDDPVDVFNLMTGANFRLRVKKVKNFPNYDDSKFDSPGPLSEDREVMKRAWEGSFSLDEIIALDKFKPYDVLKKKFYEVIGGKPVEQNAANVKDEEEEPPFELEEKPAARKTAELKKTEAKATSKKEDDDFNFDDIQLDD